MIFVYDITDRETFESVEGHYRDATRYAQKAPSFLLGNKSDLEKTRTVATDEAQVCHIKRIHATNCQSFPVTNVFAV